MKRINSKYKYLVTPKSDDSAIVQEGKCRFTILTSRLIRIEYDKTGRFEDRATQTVINRNFKVPQFTIQRHEGVTTILTDEIKLKYSGGELTKNSLYATFLSGKGKKWYFGDNENLGGTTKTLDGIDGACTIEDGIQSQNTMTILDDSKSLILADDGWVDSRRNGVIDIYLFAYRTDYIEALKAYYELTGKTPLLPRYALGNWWSRYFKYTQDEYKKLMLKFKEKEVPLSVAVLDMDWHYVDIDSKYGDGWTGFSWNKELFPNPAELMDFLRDNGMEVTLNLHPADGIREYEDNYKVIAESMNVKDGNAVEFDASNPQFIEAYFRDILHPLEDEGVSFWWIDWQQGDASGISGLDPLWILNHYHYVDMQRRNKRPIILSRYSGAGSHRYPVGFSGDTHMTWESLDFQPYFTATASNIGYGWWSHDIGGHMLGIRDDEMTTRWVQLGVFSPIMRLHSVNSPFSSKEPWNYNSEAEKIMIKFMQLRHMLMPYLYTMNYRAHEYGEPLIQPLYYKHPDDYKAYTYNRNEYYFGNQMLVSPITSKSDSVTLCGAVKTYLPKGKWFDLFNSREYDGEGCYNMYRSLDSIPVLVKAGGILPLSDYNSALENPKELTLMVFPGADNIFELYEDNDAVENIKSVKTVFSLKWGRYPTFKISKPSGSEDVIVKNREYKLVFRKINDCENIEITENGKIIPFKKEYGENNLTIYIGDINGEVTVIFKEKVEIVKNNCKEDLFSMLMKAQCSNVMKSGLYNNFINSDNMRQFVSAVEATDTDVNLKNAAYDIALEYEWK